MGFVHACVSHVSCTPCVSVDPASTFIEAGASHFEQIEAVKAKTFRARLRELKQGPCLT